jgi:hypothetical protein
MEPRSWPAWLRDLLLCAVFTGLVAAGLWWAWHPPAFDYLFNLPLAPPFLAFFLDRWRQRPRPALVVVDAAVLALALCRVFVPPFPFVSGHVLFASYAALTAAGPVLRGTSAVALVLAIITKLVAWGDWPTPLGAMALAAALVRLRRRW